MTDTTRTETDSLGTVEVPAGALYGAQTQRAAGNFRISDLRLQPPFIRALAAIKRAAAEANVELGVIDEPVGTAIVAAAAEVAAGEHAEAFVVDVFQTGSGTSTNMNMNEVLATLAARRGADGVHPNDHVNACQSSNDVIPSALRVAVAGEIAGQLRPALDDLAATVRRKAAEYPELVKTGRTHLMDATPLRVADELGGWAAQLALAGERLDDAVRRLCELPLGGTAVGSGVNAHPQFAARACARLGHATGIAFVPSGDRFRDISALDTPLEASAQLRALAVVLLKIANDLRWMASGPVAGLSEVLLEPIQPGSSIMPGKVNPVIAEAVAMVAAQVIGNDATVCAAAQSGNFQLNVMQPVAAYNLLQSVALLGAACRHLAGSIAPMRYNAPRLAALLARNSMLVTSLAPRIGYALAARIAKEAMAGERPVIEVAAEHCDIPRAELERLLDPARMASGGIA